MQLYLDTANLNEIREAASWGILSGVTTNPTLIAREKRCRFSIDHHRDRRVSGWADQRRNDLTGRGGDGQ